MGTDKPPNIRMRRVGIEVRRLRKKLGWSLATVGHKLGVSYTSISRLESGLRAFNRDDLIALLTLYQAPRDLRKAVLALYDKAREPTLFDRELKVSDDLH